MIKRKLEKKATHLVSVSNAFASQVLERFDDLYFYELCFFKVKRAEVISRLCWNKIKDSSGITGTLLTKRRAQIYDYCFFFLFICKFRPVTET